MQLIGRARRQASQPAAARGYNEPSGGQADRLAGGRGNPIRINRVGSSASGGGGGLSCCSCANQLCTTPPNLVVGPRRERERKQKQKQKQKRKGAAEQTRPLEMIARTKVGARDQSRGRANSNAQGRRRRRRRKLRQRRPTPTTKADDTFGLAKVADEWRSRGRQSRPAQVSWRGSLQQADFAAAAGSSLA